MSKASAKTLLGPKAKAVAKGAKILVEFCGQVREDDRVLIISDESAKAVGKLLFESTIKITPMVKWLRIKQTKFHGIEPPVKVARAMSNSDVIFAATHSSMAHTKARLDATKKGVRYLSLPEYSLKQLASPSLTVDFIKWAKIAKKIKFILDSGTRIEIRSKKGTDLTLNCKGRVINMCPGFCARPGALGSPPDIEINVAPIENRSNGELFIDGSIPCKEIGLIKEGISLKIKNGSIREILKTNKQAKELDYILDSQHNPKARVLAEFGIGLNPKARLCGMMLEDEGCLGTVHFGFGSNATIGGKNKINFHIDFVIRKASVDVDGRLIMENGKLVNL